MKAILAFPPLFVCLLLGNSAYAQHAALNATQIERIAKTSELWGHIKYFHPYLHNSSLDWEEAYASAIEDVIKAESGSEYGRAIQGMLDQLHDPLTQVVTHGTPNVGEDTVKYPVIRFVQDSVLSLTVHDYQDLWDYNYMLQQVSTFNNLISKSKGVIFDLRSANDIGNVRGYLSYFFKEIQRNLIAKDLPMPSLRARFHDGFVPETGGSSGGYSSGQYTRDAQPLTHRANAVEQPIVFVVNQHAEIPMVVLALQLQGKAQILSIDTLTDASIGDRHYFTLDDSLSVAIRISELAQGNTLKADYIFPTSTKEADITGLAWQVAKGKTFETVPVDRNDESNSSGNSEANTSVSSTYPNLGHRLLAAAKIWTVIHYFFAYQDLMEDDWDEVLRQFIPRFAAAKDSLEYHLAVAEMYTHIQDGHGVVASRILRQYFGTASPPFAIRFIEDQPVVVAVFPDSIYAGVNVQVGDIVLEVDGERSEDRVKRMSRYVNSSNSSALHNYISWRFLNGRDSTQAKIKIQKRDGSRVTISMPRYNSFAMYMEHVGNGRNHIPITRLINKDIGYADLDRLTSDMVDQLFIDFKDTKAIIFDMRGYPYGTAWSIAPHLTDKNEVYAAGFRRFAPMGIIDGRSKNMTFFDQPIPPAQSPYYRGKTVMLIDERTQSQAEHTGLFFEAANGTTFIGSQTAGANGDITNFVIPGNIRLIFSGHDVRHTDGRQLQKTGLVPHVKVKPTIKGIRDGKDEVLDKAVSYLEREILK